MNCKQNNMIKPQLQLHQQQQQQQQHSTVKQTLQTVSHNNYANSCSTTTSTRFAASKLLSPTQAHIANSHLTTISIIGQQHHTFNSHRSIATDSSGFSSGTSTTSCHGQSEHTISSPNDGHHSLQRGTHYAAREQQKSRVDLVRSQLIEDLNRLEKMAAAAVEAKTHRDHQYNNHHGTISTCDGSQASPSKRILDDQHSGHHTMPASMLSRFSAANSEEFDYSTLCRDEFSSFIDYSTPSKGHANIQTWNRHTTEASSTLDKRDGRKTRKSSSQATKTRTHRRHRNGVPKRRNETVGPMLVGVHEYETPQDLSYNVSHDFSNSSSTSSSSCSEQSLVFAKVHSSSSPDLNPSATVSNIFSFRSDEMKSNNEKESSICCVTSHLDSRNMAHESPHCVAHVEEQFSDDTSLDSLPHQLEPVEIMASPSYIQTGLSAMSSECGDDQEKLSEALDTYLLRVESLLKLANNDKSVSICELIEGRSSARDDNISDPIQVRDEFKTSFVYVPSSDRVSRLKPQVIQEIEVTMEDQFTSDSDRLDANYDDPGLQLDQSSAKSEKITTNLGSNFEALFSSPQISAILNWCLEQHPTKDADMDLLHTIDVGDENNNKRLRAQIDMQHCHLLEKSLLNSWIKLCSRDGEPVGSDCDQLARTIKRHMNVFVAHYNAYRQSLLNETSFAKDWHENWLFATSTRKCMPLKRAHQLSECMSPDNDDDNDGDDDEQAADKCANKNGQLSANTSQDHQKIHPKRAKMMQSSASIEINELLNYSTLLMNKYKPIKVTFVDCLSGDASDSHDEDESSRSSRTKVTGERLNKWWHRIESFYEQQPDYMSELQQTFLQLSGKVNVCHLLLNDSFQDEPECSAAMDESATGKRAKRSLEIEYESSLNGGRPQIDGDPVCFRAHGHLFELRKLRHFAGLATSVSYNRKRDALRKLILTRLHSACHWRRPSLSNSNDEYADYDLNECKFAHVARELPLKQCQQDQARFLVQISDVRVSQALPVIQFCAKISGALPIRVGWYKLLKDGTEQELLQPATSEIERQSKKLNARTETTARDQDEWPPAMRANHQIEYQNKWLSWYRFKRVQGDIMFEIRGAHLEHDFGHTFKCVIENYCSIKQCEFGLELLKPCSSSDESRSAPVDLVVERISGDHRARRPLSKLGRANQLSLGLIQGSDDDEIGRIKLNKVEQSNESLEAGQAILRTWSQRTLNKRAPLVDGGEHQSDGVVGLDASSSSLLKLDSHCAATGRQQMHTVGRLSAQAMNDCKFGTDYPYHPESLMRRLEENKMSLTLRSRLRLTGRVARNAAVVVVDDDNDDHHDDHCRANRHHHDRARNGARTAAATDTFNETAWSVAPTEPSTRQHNNQCWTSNKRESLQSESSKWSLESSDPNPPARRSRFVGCGESDVSRQSSGSTAMRPSHGKSTADSSSSKNHSFLFAGEQDNQDNRSNSNGNNNSNQVDKDHDDENNYHDHDGTQQKNNGALKDRARPEPTPRQRPIDMAGKDQGPASQQKVSKVQPLVDLSNNLQTDQLRRPNVQMRSSDSAQLSGKLIKSAAVKAVDKDDYDGNKDDGEGTDANYPVQLDCGRQSYSIESDLRPPIQNTIYACSKGLEFKSRSSTQEAQQTPRLMSASNCDNSITATFVRSQVEPRADDRSGSESRTSFGQTVAAKQSAPPILRPRPTTRTANDAACSGNSPRQPPVEDANEGEQQSAARPKSVRSLISRFNMI